MIDQYIKDRRANATANPEVERRPIRYMNHQGVEITVRDRDLSLFARLYFIERRLYTTEVMGPSDAFERADVIRFLDSFRLLAPAGQND